MILDILENSHLYLTLNKGFEKVFTFLTRHDLNELPERRYDIDGDLIYAMVAKDMGRRKEEALLETHQQYIDIQLILSGTDNMGWKPRSSCKQPSGVYDQETDLQFFSDQPDAWLTTKPGTFAIFFPEDAHMPLISSGQLHKVVVKIAVGRS